MRRCLPTAIFQSETLPIRQTDPSDFAASGTNCGFAAQTHRGNSTKKRMVLLRGFSFPGEGRGCRVSRPIFRAESAADVERNYVVPQFRGLRYKGCRSTMKITDAKVIVCSPGRNFVTLKITTEDGIYGLGDATLNGRELAVASYLTDHLVPLLIGRDARKIEDIWQYFYKGAYWRRGPVTMSAIAGVDTALWDIKAKSLNVPLYQLLGGASREGVLVYGHASGGDIEETVKAVGRYVELGYKAVRAQSGIPGLASTYGVGRGALHYEPAEKDAPPENRWSSELYMNFAPQLFTRLRKEFGPELHLLHDAHHRLTPIEAARVGNELEPSHLFWLEDPTPAELQESFRIIRQHTTTPLAVGEVFNSVYDCQQLINEHLIDYIRTTVVHAGGIS